MEATLHSYSAASERTVGTEVNHNSHTKLLPYKLVLMRLILYVHCLGGTQCSQIVWKEAKFGVKIQLATCSDVPSDGVCACVCQWEGHRGTRCGLVRRGAVGNVTALSFPQMNTPVTQKCN